MKISKHLIIIISSLVVGACSSGINIKGAGNKQTIILNAKSSNDAIKLASYRARRTCLLKGKDVKIIEVDALYQGETPEQKELIKQAKTILPKSKTRGPYTSPHYQYKATLVFDCI